MDILLIFSLTIFVVNAWQFTPLDFLSISLVTILNEFFLNVLLVFGEWISDRAHVLSHVGILIGWA